MSRMFEGSGRSGFALGSLWCAGGRGAPFGGLCLAGLCGGSEFCLYPFLGADDLGLEVVRRVGFAFGRQGRVGLEEVVKVLERGGRARETLGQQRARSRVSSSTEHRRTLSIFWSSVSSAAWIPARLTLRMLAASSIVMPWFLVMASTLPARPPEVPAAAPPAASPPARASGNNEDEEVSWVGKGGRGTTTTHSAPLVAMLGQRPFQGFANRG